MSAIIIQFPNVAPKTSSAFDNLNRLLDLAEDTAELAEYEESRRSATKKGISFGRKRETDRTAQIKETGTFTAREKARCRREGSGAISVLSRDGRTEAKVPD